jgi:poly-beta-hydroxybutyrate-responsive repressor
MVDKEPLDEQRFMREGPAKRFVEPRLLYLLRRGSSYGYQLMAEIGDLPFPGAVPDSAAVYRMLRDLEKRGLVASKWEPGEAGPAKRTYDITEAGRRRLDFWVAAFRERVKLLNRFIALCEKEA